MKINAALDLKPGEKIPKMYLDELKKANEDRKTIGFQAYRQRIANIFGITPQRLTIARKFYFGGFVEAEGSLNLSLKPTVTTIAGVSLDFNFSVTQHVNGVHQLFAIMDILQTGRIRHKGGSTATMYFEIGDRENLKTKVIPFYKKYVVPNCSPVKKARFQKFENLLTTCDQKNAFADKKLILTSIIPKWDELRMQRGQSNEAFESAHQATDFVNNCFGQPKEVKEQFNNARIQSNLLRRITP